MRTVTFKGVKMLLLKKFFFLLGENFIMDVFCYLVFSNSAQIKLASFIEQARGRASSVLKEEFKK